MIIEKWKRIESKIALTANIFRYLKVKSQSPSTGDVGDFDIVQCLNWVNVIAITKDQKIVFVKQFRHGIEDVCLEIPGGAVNPGEDLLVAAKRELREESGYTSTKWKKLGRVDANPAFMSNFCETYLALEAEKTHELELDPFEEIEVELFEEREVHALIAKGEITHSLVIAAFYFLGVAGAAAPDDFADFSAAAP